MKECNVEWYVEEGQLSVHVFPYRTFIFSGDVNFGQIAPFVAGVCCLNVALAQDKEMKLTIKSKDPIPEKIGWFANNIKELSKGRFDLTFENLAEMNMPMGDNAPILLFSGAKDSLWLLNKMKKEGRNPRILYVKGAAIAGEYRQELKHINSMNLDCEIQTINVDYIDYGEVSMAFRFRARWKSLLLLTLARVYSNELWIGIYPEDLKTEEDRLRYYSEQKLTLKHASNMLGCKIYITKMEFLCFLQTRGQHYRSCYSPDIPCDPENDFTNSCWKCRVLHIYGKYADGKELTTEESDYFHGENWMGDDHEMMDRMLKLHTGNIPPMKMLQFAMWINGAPMEEVEGMYKD
jgi:hypothetical protein